MRTGQFTVQKSVPAQLPVAAFIFVFTAASLYGQSADMKKIENLIYSIIAYDGYNFKQTFCREGSPVIYFLADTENIISVRKTFIFYWPLMGQWRIDPALLNVQLKGRIEIWGDRIKHGFIEPVLFTYTNLPEEKTGIAAPVARTDEEMGEYITENLRILTGKEAEAAVKRYDRMMEEYRESEEVWQEKIREYEAWKKQMIVRIREAKDQGKDVSGLVEEVQTRQPSFTDQPEKPNYYIYPLSEAFIINLEQGEYHIRLVDEQGSMVEGSEKKLYVFSDIRSNGIHYEYISKDKVTSPKESKIPSAVLYFDGSSDLYFQPYLQNEYNELYYNKLADNESRGNRNRTKWEKTKRLKHMWLTASEHGTGKEEILLEDLFFVSQNAEKGAGYDIIYWDGRPGSPQQYSTPGFSAFRIPMSTKPGIISIKLTSFRGNDLQMSRREIRIVRKTGLLVIVLILALFPLVVLWIAIYKRQKLYASDK